MEKRTLGKTDIEASVVGFGGIPIQGVPFGEAEKIIRGAVDLGINFFDTARGYTDSEEKIGRALEGRRDLVYLSTKAMSRDASSMERELAASLRNLRTEMIDLYQLHAVASIAQLDRVLAPGGAFEALARARDEGKVRWIGITGHSKPVLLEAIRRKAFDTVQLPFNPIEREWADEVLPEARKASMGTIGMKPLAGGAIKNTSLSIRYTLTRGIDVSIPGMDSSSEVEANVSAGEGLSPLGEEELDLLEAERSLWGDRFCRRCGYCMPCPNGLNIPFLLLIEGYYTRYGLTDWATARLKGLEKSFADCTACGECLEKCPYHLPIPELMKKAEDTVLGS